MRNRVLVPKSLPLRVYDMTSSFRIPIQIGGFVLVAAFVLASCDIGSSGNDSSSRRGFRLDNCTIPTDQLADGGVGKDGIPALTDPPLVEPGSDDAQYLADSSRVIGLLFGETPLAVPHNILWHHEIANINDWAGENLAVSYCPLTGSSLVFSRAPVNGAEFGVSGLLFKNNLVMYDRRTQESLWPQMNRTANCGEAVGTSAPMRSSMEMTWGRWKTLHPDTRVVSSQTGYARNYTPSGYPYGAYEDEDNSRLLVDMIIDERRPPKERVLGIPSGADGGVALPFGALRGDTPKRVVTIAVGGTERTVFWSEEARGAMAFETSSTFTVENGQILDERTGSVWTVDGRAVDGDRKGEELNRVDEAYVAFWFAWAAFQSETTIWTPSTG